VVLEAVVLVETVLAQQELLIQVGVVAVD